jgi:hypothetical protein
MGGLLRRLSPRRPAVALIHRYGVKAGVGIEIERQRNPCSGRGGLNDLTPSLCRK